MKKNPAKLFPEETQGIVMKEFITLVEAMSDFENNQLVVDATKSVKTLLEYDVIFDPHQISPSLQTLINKLLSKAKSLNLFSIPHDDNDLLKIVANQEASAVPRALSNLSDDYFIFYKALYSKDDGKETQQPAASSQTNTTQATNNVQLPNNPYTAETLLIENMKEVLKNNRISVGSLNMPALISMLTKEEIQGSVHVAIQSNNFNYLQQLIKKSDLAAPIKKAQPPKSNVANKKQRTPQGNLNIPAPQQAPNIQSSFPRNALPQAPAMISIPRHVAPNLVSNTFALKTPATTSSSMAPSPVTPSPGASKMQISNTSGAELGVNDIAENLFYCFLLVEKISKNLKDCKLIIHCYFEMLGLILLTDQLKSLPPHLKELLSQKLEQLKSDQALIFTMISEIKINSNTFDNFFRLLQNKRFCEHFPSLKATLLVLVIQNLEDNIKQYSTSQVLSFLTFLFENHPDRLQTIINLINNLTVDKSNIFALLSLCNNICNIFLDNFSDDQLLKSKIIRIIEKIIPHIMLVENTKMFCEFYHYALALDVEKIDKLIKVYQLTLLKADSEKKPSFYNSFILAADFMIKTVNPKTEMDLTISAKIKAILNYSLCVKQLPNWKCELIFKVFSKYIDKFDRQSIYVTTDFLIVRSGLNIVENLTRENKSQSFIKVMENFHGKVLTFYGSLIEKHFAESQIKIKGTSAEIYNNLEFVVYQIKLILREKGKDKVVAISLLNEYLQKNESLKPVLAENYKSLASVDLETGNITTKFFAAVFVNSLARVQDSTLLLDIIHSSLPIYKEIIQDKKLFPLYYNHLASKNKFPSVLYKSVETSWLCFYRPIDFLLPNLILQFEKGVIEESHTFLLSGIISIQIWNIVKRVNTHGYDVNKATAEIKELLAWKTKINASLKGNGALLRLKLSWDFRLFNVQGWDLSHVNLKDAIFNDFVGYTNQQLCSIQGATISGQFFYEEVAKFQDADVLIDNNLMVCNFKVIGLDNQKNVSVPTDYHYLQLCVQILMKRKEKLSEQLQIKNKMLVDYKSQEQATKSEQPEDIVPKSITYHKRLGILFSTANADTLSKKRKFDQTEDQEKIDNNNTM